MNDELLSMGWVGVGWGGAKTFMLSYSAYERRAADHGVGLGWGGAKNVHVKLRCV